MPRVWNQMKIEGSTDPTELAQWEAEYQQILRAQREEIEGLKEEDPNFDYGADIQREWTAKYGKGLTSDMTEQRDSDLHFDDNGIPNLPNYTFGSHFTSPVRVSEIADSQIPM